MAMAHIARDIASRCQLGGWIGGIAMIGIVACLSASRAWAAPLPATETPDLGESSSVAAGLELDDPIELFRPKDPPREVDARRVEALSLFAAARMAEAQENYPEALRLYQRALQYDPQSLPVVRQVIRMAQALDRTAEATRFTLKAIELDPSDPELLEDAIRHLTNSGKFAEAVALYEAVIKQLKLNPKSDGYIRLRIEMGRLYFVTDQSDKAADAFAEVMEAIAKPKEYGLSPELQRTLDGNRGRFYELFAEAFLAAGRTDMARRAFARMQLKSPDKAMYGYQLARAFATEKKYDEALDELQTYFDQKATKAELAPYELLKSILAGQEKLNELLPRLQKLVEADPKNVPLRYFLAGEYLAIEEWEQAEPLLLALIEEEPKPSAFRGLLKVYRQTDRPVEVLATLADVVRRTGGLEPVAAEVRALAGDAELTRRLLDLARKDPAPEAIADPELRKPLVLAMGLVAMEADQFDDAGYFFDEAVKDIEDERTPQVYLTWSIGLLLDNQYAAAVEVLQRGIDAGVFADNPTAYYYLAYALELDNQTDAAIEAAKKAAELGDDGPRIASRLAWIYYHARRYAEAAEHYRKLVERYDLDFSSEEIREVLREARLVLSNIAVIQDNIPEAEEWLEQVLDEFPDDPSALNDLGYLWADQGKNLERALEMIRKAVAAEPENNAYLDSLAWALYRLNRADEALPHILKAASGENPDGVILDHLGDVQLAVGNVKAARAAWKRAVESFDPKNDADKITAVRAKLAKHKP